MSHSVSAVHAGEILTAAERSSGDSFLMSNIRRLGDIEVSTTRRGVCRQDTVSQYMFVSWLHGYMRRHGAYRCEERKNVGFHLFASVELYGKEDNTEVHILNTSSCTYSSILELEKSLSTYSQNVRYQRVFFTLWPTYTLHLTYPRCASTLLSVIQTEVLLDKILERDLTASYKKALAEWKTFIGS